MDPSVDVSDRPIGRIDYLSSNPFEVHHLIHDTAVGHTVRKRRTSGRLRSHRRSPA